MRRTNPYRHLNRPSILLEITLLVVVLQIHARSASAFAPLSSLSPTAKRRRCSLLRLQALPRVELIRIARAYVASPTLEQLSDDFVFRGPVIGPLNKADFAATFESVGGLGEAFPDLETNAFGFTADDPIEPNRVWYFERGRGTFTGAFQHPVVGRIEPTGAEYVGPPEARSVVIDDEGKVKYQTVGYVVDRFTGDTTNGQGAVFGLYSVMGQEIDATIGSPMTVLLQKLAEVLPASMGVPQSYSKRETLPSWWRDSRLGAEK